MVSSAALARNDWNQPRPPPQRDAALLACRVGFADGREALLLVKHPAERRYLERRLHEIENRSPS